MQPIKIIGILFLIFLLIALFVTIALLIYYKLIKNAEPTLAATTAPVLQSSIPRNRNTVYQIKGKLVRYDPDLYTGAIAKNSSQHPDYVKLVQSYGRKRYQPDN